MGRTKPIVQPAWLRRAWEIHRDQGHAKGYEGPCWGPTPADVDEAKRELAKSEPADA